MKTAEELNPSTPMDLPGAPRPDGLGPVKAYQAIDLRAIAQALDCSRWLMVDVVNSRHQVILISPDEDRVACFRYAAGSGTDHIRARARALVWAQENDLQVPDRPDPQSPDVATGDLMFAPLRMRS